MGLIKATDSIATLTSAVRLSLRDIEAEAQAMIETARREAERIVEEARAGAAQITEQAREQGWNEGLAQGTAQARREVVEQHAGEIRLAVDSLTGAAAIIEASRAELENVALADVVKLALAIAARITRRQGIVDRAVLTENLREAVKMIIHHDHVRVAIHPSQRRTLDEAVAQLKLEWPAMHHVEIQEDEAILPGGCRVTSGQGEIDARLDAQLDRIAAKLIPVASGTRGCDGGAAAAAAAAGGAGGAGGTT